MHVRAKSVLPAPGEVSALSVLAALLAFEQLSGLPDRSAQAAKPQLSPQLPVDQHVYVHNL